MILLLWLGGGWMWFSPLECLLFTQPCTKNNLNCYHHCQNNCLFVPHICLIVRTLYCMALEYIFTTVYMVPWFHLFTFRNSCRTNILYLIQKGWRLINKFSLFMCMQIACLNFSYKHTTIYIQSKCWNASPQYASTD